MNKANLHTASIKKHSVSLLLFLICSAFPLAGFGQIGSGTAYPIELGYITSSLQEELLESRFLLEYSDTYGGSGPDVFYRFTVTGNASLNAGLGSQGNIYFLDSQGLLLNTYTFSAPWQYQSISLAPGTYFMVVEGIDIVTNGGDLAVNVMFTVNDNAGIVPPTQGIDRNSPIPIPSNSDGSISYSHAHSFDPVMGYGNNHHGTASHDVFYRFELSSRTRVEINTCPRAYFWTPLYIYLLNANGGHILSDNSYSSDCNGPLIETELDAGTYYVVIERDNYSYGGNYTLSVNGYLQTDEGRDRETAILIGNYTTGGSYSYHDNRFNGTSYGYGDMMGQPSDDIYYKLILGNTANVSASLCGSDFDTYLYILNTSGTVLHSNNDNGPLCTGTQSSLQVNNLAAGIYYIVAEGNGNSSGNVNLYVETEMQGSADPVTTLGTLQVSPMENYILSRTVLVDNITTEAQLDALSLQDVRPEVQYFDGLGRLVQHIAVGASPTGKDIVIPTAYDGFGREDKRYLPYEAGSPAGSGSFREDALASVYTNSAQYQFYQQEHTSIPTIPNPYAEDILESSPMSRVLESASPGRAWSIAAPHTVKLGYGVNSTDEVRKWSVTVVSGIPMGASTQDQYYAPGQLYKHILTDENGSTVIEFKDKADRIVCKKIQDSDGGTAGTFLVTDYIYDAYGNLAYVVPPALESSSSFVETDTDFLNHIYAYHYDGRQRPIAKKIPGSGWIYTVYNPAGWPVFVQDAAHRDRPGGAVWSFLKYDRLGRVILSGEMVSAESRQTLQAMVDAGMMPQGTLVPYESRDNGEAFGYTATTYPDHTDPGVQVLTANYYDNYGFLDIPLISGRPQASRFRIPNGSASESTQVNGLLTASLTRVLGTSDFLLSESLYDKKGRPSVTIVEHTLNGVDETTMVYSFVGEVLSVNRKHYKDNVLGLTVHTANNYDHAGRMVSTSEQINQQTASVTRYHYNALGQLERRTAGGKTVTQQYNPRGWLAKASSPFFSYTLSYEAPHDRYQSQYNGNIAEQIWMTGTERTPYRYSYAYDPANRLTAGISADGYGESMQYDKMGNITSLVRIGQPLIPGGAGTFAYDYGTQGNRLQSVSNSGNYSRSYQYNSQGSMVSDGQIKVSYNEVGLPKAITDMADVPKISYLYDASGQKLRRTGTVETRQYIGGIEYTGSGSGAAIDLIHTAGGIARRIGSNYVYEYFLQDHLGNNRVVYNAAGTVLQQTDYYPFGMEINRKVTSPKMPYTYNGKELQEEIGQYDYGARFFDPIIGRWNVVDPLAEMYSSYSPYAYVGNDPILFHDPNGMYRVDANGNITIDDPDEISSFFNYLNNSSGASINDMSNHIISAGNGFSWELDPINVTGSMNSYRRGDWMGDFWGRIDDAERLAGNISSINISLQQNWGMQTALSGLGFAGNINNMASGALEGAIYKRYLGTIKPSLAYGVNVYSKPVLNATAASRYIRGTGYVGLAINTTMVGTTWVAEGHFGHNTKVATAKAVTGWAGAWAGAKIGAATFGVAGSVIPGAGTGAGIVLGGILGGIGGGLGATWLVDEVYK